LFDKPLLDGTAPIPTSGPGTPFLALFPAK
jgi:hypothetical protein